MYGYNQCLVACNRPLEYLPPANEVCEGYVFTGVCLSTLGGACVVLFGGCVVLFGGCMVLFGGHAWFYWGACVVLFGGACMVLFGGHAWFYSGAMCGFIWGACMVLFGGHAWFYSGGMRGFIWGGVCGFFSFFGYNEIRSMSGQYASYWNAFLFYNCCIKHTTLTRHHNAAIFW